eukprot:SAG31_NODE_2912_length_4920_cov_3.413192_5_plen_257_part_00
MLPLPTEAPGTACADLAPTTSAARLRCRMPPGYPAVAAAHVVSVGVTGLRRQAQTALSATLRAEAKSLVGEEAIMQIVQQLQELGSLAVANAHRDLKQRVAGAQRTESQTRATLTPLKFGRRWMVMGHIKAAGRRAQMIAEAADCRVGGLIRPGYPGVCVVEGEAKQCDAFVRWAKDIWIGKVTVRGEVTVDVATSIDLEAMRKFEPTLVDLGAGRGEKRDELPSMGVLGSACKEAGLDAEFLEFVMGRGRRAGAC